VVKLFEGLFGVIKVGSEAANFGKWLVVALILIIIMLVIGTTPARIKKV
jgi:Na+-transporting NADH:ubiquinone oxidoreductase subunit NqrB